MSIKVRSRRDARHLTSKLPIHLDCPERKAHFVRGKSVYPLSLLFSLSLLLDKLLLKVGIRDPTFVLLSPILVYFPNIFYTPFTLIFFFFFFPLSFVSLKTLKFYSKISMYVYITQLKTFFFLLWDLHPQNITSNLEILSGNVVVFFHWEFA